ncbi:dienelactone hydrolase family protein [Flagellimonas sp. HMM57]|uniref:carboxylesterase family protein n=1 Tax=unclassified Flagellimonas TaxID=2644544 RepID=UPI001969D290|nr:MULTISPECIES: alpha/beta hydrolase-fold protein [unclassified Flagellimonas]UII76566.1 dienelactone hydrolase family protein [Flagellimonas sp. HMM57]
MKIITSFYVTCLLFISMGITAQNSSDYQKMIFEKDGDSLPYRMLLPKDYDASKKYPLIVLLHGSGERGNDNESQLIHGSGLFQKEEVRNAYPAIVVFPQCAANSSWSKVDVKGEMPNREFVFYEDSEPTKDLLLLEDLLEDLKKRYKLDERRFYVGGLSMGGMGTFELVKRNPKMFAAAFPICGGANPKISKKLTKLDWWVFHGDADEVVPEKYSAEMVKAMKDNDINVTYKVYPGVGHNSWDNAFAEPELLSWLFSKSR